MKHADGFKDLASGLPSTAYTFSSSVTSGVTYKFRVLARNSVGYSDNSTVLEIIAATIPGTPTNLVRSNFTDD